MIIFLLMFIFMGVPIILMLLNIVLLFAENKFKAETVNGIDAIIFLLGITFTFILSNFTDFHEWNEQISPIDSSYSPISFKSMPTFITLCLIAIVSYILLRFLIKKLSPIIASFCYGGIFLGFCLTVVLTVQFWCNLLDFAYMYFLLFPYNYILCSVRLIRNTASDFAKKISQNNYDNKLLQLCKKFLSNSVSFVLVSFLMAIPLLIIAIVILMLFGQQPDSVVKMFTETAEWTLSQKIPPPRLDYDGHYLCTVAACGDEKVVKPLRAGKRNNELIIVNRQLLVANAFEDLIAERMPRLHKLIRKTYDRVGLPISKYITTKRRSNIVYFIMKPLEWLFIFVLYTFDTKPENRIHRQYLG